MDNTIKWLSGMLKNLDKSTGDLHCNYCRETDGDFLHLVNGSEGEYVCDFCLDRVDVAVAQC